MSHVRSIWAICALILCAALAGCGGTNQLSSQTQSGGGNSTVVLTMTDTPPSNVSILSAEVTLTGVTLSPGNVSLFSGSTTVELTRLQAQIAYLTTVSNIPAGTYTSISLTFANPLLTIENDTTAAIGTCPVGSICILPPTSITNLSTVVPLTGFTLQPSAAAGLLIDVNLDSLLSPTLGANFSAGTTVTQFIPGSTTPGPAMAPPVGAEDVVGAVSNLSASSSTFTLSNAEAFYTLKVDAFSTFFQFPGSACATPGFSCLQNGQILSVDIGIASDGSIYARNLVFEDATSSDPEVEGVITSTNAASQQFNFVVHTISATGTGLKVGQLITVQYATSPQTPFTIDFLHIDNLPESTTAFTSFFTMPANLVAGQVVSVRRNSASTSATIVADRVELRWTQVTATVQSVGEPNIFLTNLPSLFFGHGGVTQIQAQTSVSPPTIYYEIGGSINASTNITGDLVSVRGPLFNTGGTNRTLLTTKVVLQHP